MKHLDLFSGIGGFALAAESVWPNVEHIFCDNDPFSQAILRKHWPNSLIYGDIKTLTADRITADTTNTQPQNGTDLRKDKSDRKDRVHIDLLTGGFPCQPFSAAGRRRGTEDDRHLWPEMLRLIRETNPTFILGENVGGLVTWDGGMVLEMVLADLEEAGYEAGAFIIPACAVGAPHRRDRVWIAAHAIGRDAGGTAGELRGTQEEERIPERDQMGQSGEPSAVRDGPHTTNDGRQRRVAPERWKEPSEQNNRSEVWTESVGQNSNVANSPSLDVGCGRKEAEGHNRKRSAVGCNQGTNWSEDWPTVAAELCTLDDGLSNGLARPRGWRNAALKGAGNAIVPQVAAEILRAMKYTND